jgi:hypothetical protein
MLQQRIPAFTITYLEKKRISDPAALSEPIPPVARAVRTSMPSHYQIGTAVYATKTILSIEMAYLEDVAQIKLCQA